MSNLKQISKPPKPIKTTIIKPLCFNPRVFLSHTMRPSRCSLSLMPSCSLTHSFPSSRTPSSSQLPHAYTPHLSLFPFKRALQQGRRILLHACRLARGQKWKLHRLVGPGPVSLLLHSSCHNRSQNQPRLKRSRNRCPVSMQGQ